MKFPTAHDFSVRCIYSCPHPSALGAFPVSIVTGQFNISGLTVSYSEIPCPFYKCAARGEGRTKWFAWGYRVHLQLNGVRTLLFPEFQGKARAARLPVPREAFCWITSAEGCVPSVPFLSLGKEACRNEELGVGAGWVMKPEIKTCK